MRDRTSPTLSRSFRNLAAVLIEKKKGRKKGPLHGACHKLLKGGGKEVEPVALDCEAAEGKKKKKKEEEGRKEAPWSRLPGNSPLRVKGRSSTPGRQGKGGAALAGDPPP